MSILSPPFWCSTGLRQMNCSERGELLPVHYYIEYCLNCVFLQSASGSTPTDSITAVWSYSAEYNNNFTSNGTSHVDYN